MRLLLFLVRLFPPGFRAQFGAEMIADIREDYARASHGVLRVIAFSFATSIDLVLSALAERVAPTFVNSRQVSRSGGGMGSLLSGWVRDCRQAIRSLRRTPAFTAIAIGTLGLAIGATAGVFSVVDTVLLDALPYANADRLVYIAGTAPGSDLPEEFGLGTEFYVQYREQSKLLEDVALFTDFTGTLRAGDRAERPRMAGGTNMLNTLGVKPILGRLPVPEDEDRVAVISYAVWQTWFGGDPGVIGQSVFMADGNRTVIGVMGQDFWFPTDPCCWLPFVFDLKDIVPGRFGWGAVGRMRPGVEQDALVRELDALAQRLPERFGGSANYARLIERFLPVVRPLRTQLTGDVSRPLWLLLASAGIVLLIACANVANLFMVRAERNQRDLAIRRAIGAGRGQLFRSQIAESVVVAILAGILAMFLARFTIPLFIGAAPEDVPRLDQAHIGAATLLFTLAVSVLTALLCGLVPALRASTPNLMRLRDGSRGSTRKRQWGRDGLVVAQTALALVLLIGSGLLVRSFDRLRNVDPGYDTTDIFTFQIAPDRASLTDGPSFARFHTGFAERIAALPGVESVGLIENVPLNESTSDGRFRTETMVSDGAEGALLQFTFAGENYFRTMGIELLRGRGLERADRISAPGNVVISRTAANLLWPGEDPIGRRMLLQDQASREPGSDPEPWQTVVGVVEDVMQSDFRETPQPLVYFPLAGPTPTSWVISSPAYVVKTKRADRIAPEIRELVREVAPEAPMYRVYTMTALASQSMVQLSFTMLALGITSILALILGTVGLYGVLSYVVAERTREIGVRMALGAQAKAVRRMVVGQGVRVVMLGVLIGVVIARASTRALGGLLFEVHAADIATFIGMSAAMMLVGLAACYFPARRASGVDPLISLRNE